MYMLVMLKTMLKTVLKYEKNHRHIHFLVWIYTISWDWSYIGHCKKYSANILIILVMCRTTGEILEW